MDAIDFLLNLAGLLLCMSWRSVRLDPLARSAPVTLIGTLKRTELRRLSGWQLAVALSGILGLRSLVYWLVGAPAEWTPKLNLELIILPFRIDVFTTALVFSCLSFLRIVVVFYFWMLMLTMINRASAEPDAIQRVMRLQLGKASQWPWPVQILVPFAIVMLLWLGFYPVLISLNVLSASKSLTHTLEQGLLVGLSLFISLKYLLPPLLLLHLIASYVYLGNSAFWDFVAATALRLTGPLRRLPVRFAKLDFSPILGAVLILWALQWLPNLILSKMTASKLSTWPL
jgi:uncharacterized protein YggT (Ycf19 family)